MFSEFSLNLGILLKKINYSIKSFQAEWGGEFQSLTSYLLKNGITQHSSCPKYLNKMVVQKESTNM